ncbi:MAG: SUMF1/EgtB/PvdO family nonheme iron enzyme, partial [Acidobacteriota bacterium]
MMGSQKDGTITLLHLSDLHARTSTAWDAKRVTRTLVDDLKALADDGLRPDLVLFTGDLAWAGTGREFSLGWKTIEAVQAAYGPPIADEAVFLVPGNHDVDRTKVDMRDGYWLRGTNRDEVESLIADGGRSWKQLTARLDPYRRFLKRRKLDHLCTDANRAIWHARHELVGTSIGLAGFNTSWTCGADREKGRLWMGAHWQHEMLHEAVHDAKVRIALLHHPPSWLHEHEAPAFEEALQRDFHLVLHGHRHRAWVRGGHRDHATLEAAACYDRADRDNGYSLIQLDLATQQVHVHLREYKSGGWVKRCVPGDAPDGVWMLPASWLGDAADAESASTHASMIAADAAPGGPTSSLSAASAEQSREIQELLRRFRETQTNENVEIALVGFPSVRLRLDVELEDVYVPLRAVAQDAMSEHKQKAFGAGRERDAVLRGDVDVPLDDAFRQAKHQRGLAVIGDPGSGKTTLLKHFLLTAPELLGLPADTVPILVLLRRLAAPDAGLREVLQATIRADAYFDDARAKQLVDHLLVDARVLLLIDGLDEVADADVRARVTRWIEAAARQQRRWRFVLTSRYAGYQADARLRGGHFLELHVRNLAPNEARAFIGRWYRAVVEKGGRGPDGRPAQAEDADHRSALLCARIFDDAAGSVPALRDLACNPMMLQLLCLMHWDQGRLPERRASLYQACIETLLQLWREEVHQTFDADAAQAVLEPLAWHMQIEGAEELPRTAIETVIAGPLRNRRQVLDYRPSGFLDAIRDQTGVLVSVGRDHFAFLHLSFQEFLAARHVRSQLVETPDLVRDLAARFAVKGWREVVLLTLGLTSPSLFGPVMRALIDACALSRDALLASDCLRDAAEPSAVPLLQALADSVDDDGERFQVLRLLKSEVFSGWEEATIGDGRTGREVLDGLRVDEPDDEVRGLLRELLGIEAPAIVSGVGEQEAGSERTHEQDGSVLVYVPSGEYTLGAEDIDEEEKPIHTVTLSPYWIGKYPVTNAQYRTFLESTGYDEPEEWHNKQFNGPDQPVVGVTWHDAQAYCAWAGLVLPSEAQWEAAARGTDQRAYPWGNAEPTEKLANFGGKVGRTTPVGSYPAGAGPFGALDQAGNVREWCLDLWDDAAYASRAGSTNPVRQGENVSKSAYRVLRGGSW